MNKISNNKQTRRDVLNRDHQVADVVRMNRAKIAYQGKVSSTKVAKAYRLTPRWEGVVHFTDDTFHHVILPNGEVVPTRDFKADPYGYVPEMKPICHLPKAKSMECRENNDVYIEDANGTLWLLRVITRNAGTRRVQWCVSLKVDACRNSVHTGRVVYSGYIPHYKSIRTIRRDLPWKDEWPELKEEYFLREVGS